VPSHWDNRFLSIFEQLYERRLQMFRGKQTICMAHLFGICAMGFVQDAIGQTQIRFQSLTPGINGDNFAQAIELRIAPGHNQWAGQTELAYFDAAGTEYFVFPFVTNPPQNLASADACGLTSVLVATQEFFQMSGLLPDVLLPPARAEALALLHSEAGAVCFRGNGAPDAPDVNLCVAYGHAQVCSVSGLCCKADGDCSEPGETCSLAPGIAVGRIPFTASVNGHQKGFTGGGQLGASGCPAPGISITGVTALQQAAPMGPGCCHDEACHRNADFGPVQNPVWKNSQGQTAGVAPRSSLQQGEAVFRTGTFNGNLRNCQTCHLPEDGFGLRPESIARLAATDPLNALFQAEHLPGAVGLEDPCLMRQGNRRGLILENVLGEPPAFRASMPLLNIRHTAPFGWTPCFGGADNLRDFCQVAVTQHYPRLLPRNNDPNTGAPLSNRAATEEELALMEEFQFSLKTVVNDGRGDLKGPLDGQCVGGAQDGRTCGPCPGSPPVCPEGQCPDGQCVRGTVEDNREDNLDRLIASFLDFCPGASSSVIAAGRARFQTAGCINCHLDPFLGQDDVFATGTVDHANNQNTGCPGGCAGSGCRLPSEDDLCDNCGDQCPGCDGTGCAALGRLAFDIRPLVDVARIKSGSAADPAGGTFFHDGLMGTLKEAIEFYQSPASRAPVLPSSPREIVSLLAFLRAIVQSEDPAVCPEPIGCSDVRRLRGRCLNDGRFEALVILNDASHETQSVKVSLNGTPHDLAVVGKFAQEFVCCPIGPVLLTLDDPAGCVAPVELECAANPVGACCRADGFCGVDQLSVCAAIGGSFQGEGATCTPGLCPQPPPGACCFPDGSCGTANAFTCTGAFQGNDTGCEPNPCPQPPRGACCFVNGTCAVTIDFECPDLFLGDATACEPNDCPEPTGACCFPSGACTEGTQAVCDAAPGSYQGHGTDCAPNPCPQPTGACCHPDGTCTDGTQPQCVGGVYQGDGTACDPQLCPQPTGACCRADSSCGPSTEEDCAGLGDLYRGDGSSCATHSCLPPTCPEIRRLRGGCNSNGSVRVLVILDNHVHDGQSVSVSVDDAVLEIPIVGRFAQTDLCCPQGTMTISLLDPAGCVAPIQLTCP
jgi:hypothetical protein